jgi:hypothetical protein
MKIFFAGKNPPLFRGVKQQEGRAQQASNNMKANLIYKRSEFTQSRGLELTDR